MPAKKKKNTRRPAKFTLEPELRTFRKVEPALIEAGHRRKFIVIKGNEVSDPFPNFEKALRYGYDKYKLSGFLAKQIDEEPAYVSRLMLHAGSSDPLE